MVRIRIDNEKLHQLKADADVVLYELNNFRESARVLVDNVPVSIDASMEKVKVRLRKGFPSNASTHFCAESRGLATIWKELEDSHKLCKTLLSKYRLEKYLELNRDRYVFNNKLEQELQQKALINVCGDGDKELVELLVNFINTYNFLHSLFKGKKNQFRGALPQSLGLIKMNKDLMIFIDEDAVQAVLNSMSKEELDMLLIHINKDNESQFRFQNV